MPSVLDALTAFFKSRRGQTLLRRKKRIALFTITQDNNLKKTAII